MDEQSKKAASLLNMAVKEGKKKKKKKEKAADSIGSSKSPTAKFSKPDFAAPPPLSARSTRHGSTLSSLMLQDQDDDQIDQKVEDDQRLKESSFADDVSIVKVRK